ncbi:YcjX family protein [Jannaschia sp. LMIT008]|uniref:YcjX family protein n=1 Tax=Jannaschia maritima TaxID=3032585 RepID=UPI002811F25F|nr:YcjX family protein [Jannaschia sp. LMIT008]
MVIGRVADAVGSAVGGAVDGVAGLFDPGLRLGVTGLARSGKTVFITSLVANMIDRGRMPALTASSRIEAAFLQPQPDDTVPRFEYESNLHTLTGPTPHWPDSTRAVSELRLSLRVRQGGMLSGLSGARVLHLDIVDYPGEWLLDLSLMDQGFDAWSARALTRLATWGVTSYADALAGIDPDGPFHEGDAQTLARAYTVALHAARDAGAYDLTPGRFLLPGEMDGSPVLTFAPLPPGTDARGTLRRELARRFAAYKAQVVRPFFRDHFARLDRQVVLLDVLGAIRRGPGAVAEMREAMTDLLRAFRPGRIGWLMSLAGLRRVDRILFAATKADHLHHTQHARLQAILEAMVRDARDRADFAGATTKALALASLRTTTEETREVGDETVAMIRGHLLDGRRVALHPGALPEDPMRLLGQARAGADGWGDGDYDLMDFAPAPGTLRRGEGPPHIRMDRAAEFLFGDRL